MRIDWAIGLGIAAGLYSLGVLILAIGWIK